MNRFQKPENELLKSVHFVIWGNNATENGCKVKKQSKMVAKYVWFYFIHNSMVFNNFSFVDISNFVIA